jgi:hypothetical protein
LQWLKAILEAAKGNRIDFGDVMIVLIGDPFQLPAIGGASVYAGAAMLAGLPGETPAATWKRLVHDVNRKRGGSLKCVLNYTKPYNQGGWIALHSFTRCKVLTEQMRADDEQQAFMRRVRWGYSLDSNGEPWKRVRDKRQLQRGRGHDSGRLTKASEEAREALIEHDADKLSELRLQARTAAELKHHEFASAPVITPRNECRNAIIMQRVLEFAREHGRRAVRYRATDHVHSQAREEDDLDVWSVFERARIGCGDAAVAELADYYGVKGDKDDNDSRACAKVRPFLPHATVRILCSRVARQVPLDFWFVEDLPMVLNENR